MAETRNLDLPKSPLRRFVHRINPLRRRTIPQPIPQPPTEERQNFLRSSMTKEEYLKRLPEIDQGNLLYLVQKVSTAFSEHKEKGVILAVGGTVSKEGPRKDIDTILILEPTPQLQRGVNESYVAFARRDFEHIKRGLDQLISKENSPFLELTFTPPIENQEYPGLMLKHDGGFKLIPKHGVPIEIIRAGYRNNPGEYMANEQRPYVLLSEF